MDRTRSRRDGRISDLRAVRYFVAVAEELHFGRAARRVHLTQPALSQSVRRLERDLGCELLLRSSRSVALTPAGRAFLDEARLLLEQAETLVERSLAAAGGLTGELSVGYSPSIQDTVTRLLAEFAHDRPHLVLHHRQEYAVPLVEAVRGHALDGAFVHAATAPDDLATERVRDLPVVCVVSDDHPLATGESVTLAEVAAHPLAFARSPVTEFWRTVVGDLFARHGLEPCFAAVDDPVATISVPAPDHVWIVPSEHPLGPGHVLRIEPPEHVAFDFTWDPARVSAPLAALLERIRVVRDAPGWLFAPAERA